MRRVLLLIVFLLPSLLVLSQEQSLLLGYQAVARNASGEVHANKLIAIQVYFTTHSSEGTIYYSEKHQVETDINGYFNLELGSGKEQQGTFESIPWTDQSVWVNTIIYTEDQPQKEVRNSHTLLSVPYALYAKTAQQLVTDEEVEPRNHSIYWLTGGNRDTRPPIHYIGTRDQVDFVLKIGNKELMRLKENGQYRITTKLSGADTKKEKYPLTVKAKRQGIWIKINETRSSDNNFVTFEDNGGIQGRIEGQTVAELLLDPFFLIQQAANIAEGVKLGVTIAQNIAQGASDIAAGTAAAATLFFIWSAPGWFMASGGEIAQGVAAGVEAIALAANVAETTTVNIREIGVQYSSGSEDYAEYLERLATEQDMESGEIVAVVGGKLTRNTHDAQMLKVISHAPAVLGNMPQPDVADLYEKVAFLGQVNVRITGAVNAGDYIIPSGKNDGFGIAIAPEDMSAEQYGQIVGVAWETLTDRPIQKVKIGVGMNRNELAPKVAQLSQRVDNIINYLEGKSPLHPGKEMKDYLVGNQSATQLEMLWTNEEFDRMVEERVNQIKQFYQQMEKDMPERAAYLEKIPGYKAFMADPVQGLKDLRRDPNLASYWAQLDRMVQERMNQQNEK